MKLGIVLSTPNEGSLGVVVRVTDLIKSLADLDVEIHIFAPFDLSDLGKIHGVFFHRLDNVLTKLGISEAMYGVLEGLLRNPFTSRNFILNRKILLRIVTSFSSAVLSSVKDYDLDLLQGEQEIAALSCLRLKKELDIPIIASLHNVWPEELVASRIIDPNSSQFANLLSLEQKILDDADMILVLSEGMKDYFLQNLEAKKSNIVIVPLGSRQRIDEVEYVSRPSRTVHAGLLSELDNVELFIESMPYIKKNYPDSKFYLTKKGEAYKSISNLAAKLSVNPEFFWYQRKSEFLKFLQSCHVGIVTSRNHATRKFGYTMKFFDYLSFGIPVVSNDIGGWTSIIQDEKIGILTDSNPRSFAEGALELLMNPDLRYELGKRCLNLSKTKFNIDNIAQELKREYFKLIK